MAYSERKANLFNQLLEQGYGRQAALDAAGIAPSEYGDYSVGPNGFIGPLILGSGVNNTPTNNVPDSTYVQTPDGQRGLFIAIEGVGSDESDTVTTQPPPAPTTTPLRIDITTFDAPLESETVETTAPGGLLPGFSPYGEPDDPLDLPVTSSPSRTTFDAFGAEITNQQDAFAFDEATLAPAPVPVDAFSFDERSLEVPQDAFSFDEAAFNQEQITKAKLREAQDQSAIQQRQNETTKGDWRVRLRLLPGANYLYKAAPGKQGILKPLAATDGVIFPYVPQILTNYTARYDPYDLVHSNYRGYFYRNSSVNEIQITGTFTAQDTQEAEYLLAVIHFFRSVTKMFYGKDSNRGAPPPLVELSGLGQHQFNNHPCLVSTFVYNLPNNVNYIRTTPNNQGLNLTPRRPVSATPNGFGLAGLRRDNAGLPPGAVPQRQTLGEVTGVVSGLGQSTYVPTKIELQINLLPIQTRQQVSQQFSLENFANGNLLKGGFW